MGSYFSGCLSHPLPLIIGVLHRIFRWAQVRLQPPNIPVDFHVFYLRVKPIFAGEIKIMENLPLTLSTPNLPKEAIMYSMMLAVPHREVLSQMGDDGIINRFLCRNDPKVFIHTLKRSQFDQFFFFNQLHRSKISLSATNTAAPKPRKY